MKSNILEEKNRYLNDKKKFKSEFETQLGYKIRDVEFIKNNDAFDQICNALLDFESFTKIVLGYDIKAEVGDMITLVEKRNGMTLKLHNAITFTLLNDGSHIRFSPYNSNGIEISRVYVNPVNQRKGIGSLLMKLMESSIDFAEAEPEELYLECTGAVGAGKNLQEIGIDTQTKFFRKFGFRVNNGKEYPHFVSMTKMFQPITQN